MSGKEKEDVEQPVADIDPASPAQVAEPAAEPAAAPTPAAEPAQTTPDEYPQQEPAANEVVVPGNLPPAQDAMHRKLEDLATASDLSTGQIKPETYHDLFGKKDTLGKLGTLFGLLVSGAGSGLTGQPNAVLAAMDKQIQNDVEAQKQNVANKQSWYKLAMDRETNLANIGSTEANTSATRTATEATSIKNDQERWANAQAHIKESAGTTQARHSVILTGLQQEQDRINRMPEGVTKANYQAKLDGVAKPYFAQQMAGDWDNHGRKREMLDALAPDPAQLAEQKRQATTPSDPNEPVVNETMYNNLRNAGKVRPNSSIALDEHQALPEVQGLTKNRQDYFAAQDHWHALNKLGAAGQVPFAGVLGDAASGLGSAAGTAIGAGLAGPAGAVVGNGAGNLGGKLAGGATSETSKLFENERSRYIDDLATRGFSRAEIDSILPRYNDTAAVRRKSYELMNEMFKNRDKNMAPYLDQPQFKGLRVPFRPVPYVESKGKAEEKSKDTASTQGKVPSFGF